MLVMLSGLLCVGRAAAAPIDSPFELIDLPPLSVPADLACADVRSEEHAFAAYEAVRRELAGGAPPGEVDHIDCFLPQASSRNDGNAVLEDLLFSVFDADVLYGYLERQFEQTLRSSLLEGQGRRGVLSWRSGNLGMAALYAFEATGDRRFFDLYRRYFDRVMMIRDDVLGWMDDYHGKVMKAWGASNFRGNDDVPDPWVAHVTHFGVIIIPATGFARLALTRSDLADKRDWGREVIAFFDEAYRQFETDLRALPGGGGVWYWRPFEQRFEATNHIHLVGQALLNVAAVSDDPLYAERIRWIIDVFERGVTIDDRGFASWNYSPWFEPEEVRNRFRNSRLFSEPTRKSAITVPFLYEAVEEGYLVDGRILNAVTKTIRDWILDDGVYKLYTHPQDSRAVEREDREKNISSIASIGGFHSAENVDPGIAEAIRAIVSSRPDLYPGGWFELASLARSYARFLAPTVADAD